ncbi:hypothetical protein D9758_014904 [Tetrapyrgos nigripes]|uniref:Uncharacterized protein n=1 Tax=Tetrapyrgos nigripes TaxID=182062 RepID=A0A8H5CEC2_9AGAR|nr:hypothetical protein D9758_014904 [Tetrapyrgos nigripes]
MVNRQISTDLKECAVRLWEAGWDRGDICYALAILKSSLYQWVQIFEELGTVNKPPSPLRGRPRILGLAAFTAAQEIYKNRSTNSTYLDELVWYLAIHHDVVISKSALHENLQQAGLSRKLLSKIAKERNEALRRDYIHSVQTEFSGTGTEFVTVDESSKDERTLSRRYGYALEGQWAVSSQPFVRGDQYSVSGFL